MIIQTITLQVKVSVGTFAARTAGAHGNSLQVSTCPSATAYESISTSLVASTSTANAVGNTTIAVDEGTYLMLEILFSFLQQQVQKTLMMETFTE